MDGSFDKRGKSFEAKWAVDEETKFKLYARRNKLLGMWAAAQMGVTGSEAEVYAREVVKSDFDRPGDDDVFDKVAADLKAKNVAIGDDVLRRQMTDLLDAAMHEINLEAQKR